MDDWYTLWRRFMRTVYSPLSITLRHQWQWYGSGNLRQVPKADNDNG